MNSMRTVPFVLLVVVLVAACGNGSPGTDAGDVDPTDDGGFDIPMPALPVLTPCPEGWVEVPPDEPDGVTTCDPWPDGGPAVLTPCPDGWREVTDPETGTVTCDPWPETGYEECTAVDEAHFPGEPGCIRVGTACSPDDDWATDLPGDRPIRYVLAGAAAGGDGTRASPFGTIQEAMSGAPSGTVVALSKGTFDEVVVLGAGVTLWGACVAETLVASSVPAEDAGTLNVRGRDVGVRNLRVSGRRPGIWASGRFRTARVEDVVVDGATVLGWLADQEAVIEGRSIVVRDTRSRESDLELGRGLTAMNGAQVELQRAVFSRNRDIAIRVGHPDTVVRLTDAVVQDTESRESDRHFGRGLNVQDGAAVEVRRGVFERNRSEAVAAFHADTSVTLEDVVVRDTQSRESDRQWGRGLNVQEGAAVEVHRGLFERNRDVAVVATQAGTSVTLEDVVVRDTQSRESDRQGGRGLSVQQRAVAQVRRGVFERNLDGTVVAFDAGTSVTLEDVAVRDTLSRESDGLFGTGVGTYGGGHAELRSFLVTGNALCGIQLAHGIDPDTDRLSEHGGTMDLYNGGVSHNVVCGANMQTRGFDLRRLQNNVLWYDNGMDLDMRELPVPDMATPIPEM